MAAIMPRMLCAPLQREIERAARNAFESATWAVLWANGPNAPDDDNERLRAVESRLFDSVADATEELPDLVRAAVRDQLFVSMRGLLAERLDR